MMKMLAMDLQLDLGIANDLDIGRKLQDVINMLIMNMPLGIYKFCININF